MKSIKSIILFIALTQSIQTFCQDYRPGLFFREDWKETPAEIPVNQNHIANKDLILSTYGMDKDSLKKSHHETPIDDPYYLWSGLTKDNWVVTLKHKDYYADLSGYSKIMWRSKQAGFHNLRIVLKLQDGRWLISDQFEGPSSDWKTKEFNIQDIHWWFLDIHMIKEKNPVPGNQIDLSKVDEIGFTDLMKGGLSNACARLDWIEVYCKATSRAK